MSWGHYKRERLREVLLEKVIFILRLEGKQKLLEKEVRWSDCSKYWGRCVARPLKWSVVWFEEQRKFHMPGVLALSQGGYGLRAGCITKDAGRFLHEK